VQNIISGKKNAHHTPIFILKQHKITRSVFFIA